ncbi:prostate stem cell antigen-like [Colossoma macropomum]|uniref:prostate stem cell antigen-like n=1 Tax=Colossoma macropomum TaxID=42526 RepID=UPI001863D6DB|nr:prostate stem cell antigen-like [Colossoma macropomum]
MKTLVTLMLVYMLFSEALQPSAALQCYECDRPTCDLKPVNCTSSEDRCHTTKESGGQKTITKGCTTQAKCEENKSMKCCATDLCNSAEGVKLSLLIMLVPLISTLFI